MRQVRQQITEMIPKQLSQTHGKTYKTYFISYMCSVMRLFVHVSLLTMLSCVPAFSDTSTTPCEEPDVCMAQGRESFRSSAFRQAIVSWTKAVQLYKKQNRPNEQRIALIHLSQAYHALGRYERASQMLEMAHQLASAEPTISRTYLALMQAGRGNIAMGTGSKDEAKQFLEEALSLAQEDRNVGLEVTILNDIGNLLIAQDQHKEARDIYKQSARLAKTIHHPMWAAKALTHAAMASTQLKQYDAAKIFLNEAWKLTQGLRASHDKAYTLLDMGLSYHALWQRLGATNKEVALSTATHNRAVPTPPQSRGRAMDGLLRRASQSFHEAVEVAEAEQISDLRVASYAWGYLGRLYEAEHRYDEALQLTRRAILAAQKVDASEALYRWQWQTGRVLKAQGKLDGATGAYRQAVETLQSIDPEVLTRFGPAPSSFREAVKPVFLGLVDLLLQRTASPHVKEPHQLLIEARQTAERLKAAELQDYFRDPCIDLEQKDLTPLDEVLKIAPTAVIVYPILLRDRLELLVTRPTGLRRYTVPVGEDVITTEIRMMRQKLVVPTA